MREMNEHLERLIRHYTSLRDFHMSFNQEDLYHRECILFYERAAKAQQTLLDEMTRRPFID